MNKITGRELDPNQFPAWAEFTPSSEALTKVSARAGFKIDLGNPLALEDLTLASLGVSGLTTLASLGVSGLTTLASLGVSGLTTLASLGVSGLTTLHDLDIKDASETVILQRNGSTLETLIDTVSDGVTTKAMARIGAGIIESGTNSNGSWVKFSDGTMWCRGGIYSSTSISDWGWRNYPIQFIEAPAVVGIARSGLSTSIYPYFINVPTATQYHFRTANSSAYSNILWIAIGRWKA